MNPFHVALSIPTAPVEAAPADTSPVARSGFGSSGYGSTVTFRDGVATYSDNAPTSMNTADLGNGHVGILGSATSAMGSPIAASAITPTSLVMCDGMQTTAANAERLGYLVKNAATGLYEPGPAARMSEKAEAEKARIMAGEPAEKAPTVGPEQLDANSEAAYQHFTQSTESATQSFALHEWTTTGDISSRTIGDLARQAGTDPATMSRQIDTMRGAFMTQAHAAIRQAGVTPETFTEWANTDAGFKVTGAAIREHIATRSTKPYAGAVARYLESLAAHNPAAAMGLRFEGGVTASLSGKTVLLNIPGLGQVPFAVAMRQGLAKVAPR
ncbi:hypothetical protein [Lichenibacterium dinghuense]|uniref:hypothetical protein n=1 Tax=Lichenibacterium dinghuense TaxID=2895977 RepID=UPI001F320E4E|nr:hypothetical protein [Lichenibacterium sp. 6Y81]